MQTEFEAKFYPVIKDKIREQLRSVGASCEHQERLMRRAMATRDEYPQLPCHYIRVRDEGNVVRMSAKVHANADGDLSDQKELDITVSDYDKTIQLMEIMGFEPDMYQETLRETWHLDGAEVEIDTWPGLDPYVEIEASDEAHVKKVAEKLGLRWETRRITSVVEVYAEMYNLSIDKVKQLLAHTTFNNNQFVELGQ